MLALQPPSDRLEIEQLLTTHVDALNRRDFDAWDEAFMADAYVDCRATGSRTKPCWLPDSVLSRFRGSFIVGR